jgi:hypothetical protein
MQPILRLFMSVVIGVIGGFIGTLILIALEVMVFLAMIHVFGEAVAHQIPLFAPDTTFKWNCIYIPVACFFFWISWAKLFDPETLKQPAR